jgi:hypothetical protein
MVRIAHDVVRGIGAEIMRGFGVTRRRGAEAGGVLFGRLDGTSITVEKHEPVPCEYAFGPSYILSDDDTVQFEQAIAKSWSGGDRAVGFYRGHTREGLTPDAADAGTWARHFGGHNGVLLLIKPYASRPAVASAVFPREGQIIPDADAGGDFEFAVEPPHAEHEAGHKVPAHEHPPPEPLPIATVASPVEGTPAPLMDIPVVAAPPDLASVPVPVAESTRPPDQDKMPASVPELRPQPTMPEAEPPPVRTATRAEPAFALLDWGPRGNWRTGSALAALMIAAIALGAAMGYEATRQPVGTSSAAAAVDPYSLGLTARLRGDAIVIHWDGASPAAKKATSGTLVVASGERRQEIPLRDIELPDGYILFRTDANEAAIRLEMKLPDGRVVAQELRWRRDANVQQ